MIGGSIPERDPTDEKIYNTCTVYNPEGKLIATHRKVHLFDIDVPGKIRFQESETLTAGRQLTHVDTGTLCLLRGFFVGSSLFPYNFFFLSRFISSLHVPFLSLTILLLTTRHNTDLRAFAYLFVVDFGKIGVGICYDIRFPEPAMIAARQGNILLSFMFSFS